MGSKKKQKGKSQTAIKKDSNQPLPASRGIKKKKKTVIKPWILSPAVLKENGDQLKQLPIVKMKKKKKKNKKQVLQESSEVNKSLEENGYQLKQSPSVKTKKKKKQILQESSEVNKSLEENGNQLKQSPSVKIKKKKKKQILQESSEVNKSLEENGSQLKQSPLVKIKKRRRKKKQVLQEASEVNKNDEIDIPGWTREDLLQLLIRIGRDLPAVDRTPFKMTLRKINWTQISFGLHSAEDCQDVWGRILRKLRKFRLLREIVQDARCWLAGGMVIKKKGLFHVDEKQVNPKNEEEFQMEIVQDK